MQNTEKCFNLVILKEIFLFLFQFFYIYNFKNYRRIISIRQDYTRMY